MSESVTLNVKGLDQLMKALKAKPPTTHVGILGGGKANRSSDGGKGKTPTNAEIGAAHEFGAPSRGLPIRSFLRAPIADRLQKEMEKSGALNKDVLADVLKQGTVVPWMQVIAILAEGIVAEAFDTGGFGKWKAHAPGYTNNTGDILVDTKQLRDSITSEVKT